MTAAALCLLFTAPSWTIADHGRTTFAIMLAPGSSPSMQHGAEELQSYIEQISGVRLEVFQAQEGQSVSPKRHLIAIEDGRHAGLGPEEYRITSGPNGVTIAGGAKRGAMYGCYALLEDVLGVRWYNARCTKVPKRARLTVPPLDLKGSPAFEYREPFFTEAFDGDWAARNRTNGNSQRLDAAHGGRVSYGAFVHTFSQLVPPETYFAQHPEYFSMIDGQRKNGYFQLCLTNPDVVKIVVAGVERWIEQNPEATIFSVSQNDTYSNCQCPECKRVEAEEGAPSGVLLRFVNQVAEEVEKRHPGVLIDTLAYQWSEKPPLHVKPRKNVRIRIAPIGACFGHPLDGCEVNAQPFQNLKDWAKVTGNIYIWHYTTNFANYLQPLPNLDEISGDLKLFKKYGVVGVFDEGDYSPGGGGDMSELKAYLLAKLMWDPERDAKAVIADYLLGVYHEASPYIGQWLDLTHAAARAGQAHPKIYDPPSAPYLPDDALAKGDALFDQAERAVGGDLPALAEVQRARLGLYYVELMRTKRDDPAFARLAHIVAVKLRKYGIGQTSEGRTSEDFLKSIGQ